jgi:hypothetical protein
MAPLSAMSHPIKHGQPFNSSSFPSAPPRNNDNQQSSTGSMNPHSAANKLSHHSHEMHGFYSNNQGNSNNNYGNSFGNNNGNGAGSSSGMQNNYNSHYSVSSLTLVSPLLAHEVAIIYSKRNLNYLIRVLNSRNLAGINISSSNISDKFREQKVCGEQVYS